MELDEQLRAMLEQKIEELDKTVDGGLQDDTPLIASGLLDSLALLHLAMWIEGEAGTPVDLKDVDIVKEWNTIPDIVAFIEKRRPS